MKKSTTILLATTAVTVGIALYLLSKKNKCNPIDTSKIADEGYETAHDILYSHKRNKPKDVHYGPVLPA
jgi:hypothetical protein